VFSLFPQSNAAAPSEGHEVIPGEIGIETPHHPRSGMNVTVYIHPPPSKHH